MPALPRCRFRFALPLAVSLVCLRAWAVPVLFDFEGETDPAAFKPTGVNVRVVSDADGKRLRVESGHTIDWPGITLSPPDGAWDLSAYQTLELELRNVGTNEVTVCCRVDNPGADGVKNCLTGRISLQPGETGVLRQELTRVRTAEPPVKLFGMRGYPFDGTGDEKAIHPDNIVGLVVFVPKPAADHAFEIDSVRAVGTYTPPAAEGVAWTPETFLPFIDTFGQYIHRDWPGKTRDAADLAAKRRAEAEELRARPGPEDRDVYGGWAGGPKLKATGFFYPAKQGGKWWLVDPEGNLFFSHGMDCIRASDSTPIDDRDGWFADFPGDLPGFEGFFGVQGNVVRGYYQGKQPRGFNFAGANVKRKYGENWQEAFAEVTHARLRSWGMNTIANWSDPSIYLQRKTPYVVSVHFGGKTLEGSSGYWGKFRDVFDPSFGAALRERMAREKGASAGDPWCIGYFVDNEISWGNDTSLAEAALSSPPDQEAKRVLLADLRAKYETIAALNAAWGTEHASWDALAEHREAPDAKKAREDLVAFYRKTAEQYFRTCRDAVKEVAPDNLYLGCRFAWVNNVVASVAAEYCDVVSYNLYRRSVADFAFPGGKDVPLIIGEFHFGALDRGMFHTGLVKVNDQDERAAAYASYVRGALAHPQFVGCHWFKYMDEPTTGRALDGENYQIGFVDIVDTPYPETVEACREVGYAMYPIRAGSKAAP